MAASTKLVLLVLALLLGVSILFYGVMFDGDGDGTLDVTEPAATRADGDAAATPSATATGRDRTPPPARPALSAGGERPSLGDNVRRPSLNAAATPPASAPAARDARPGAAADPGSARPSLGGAARRPLVAARPSPGQIEMGAGRGPLAGGTRLPETPVTTPAASEEAPSGAEPLARPETTRPALGGSTRRPSLSTPPPSSSSAAGRATGSNASERRPSTRPSDPADVLVSRYTIRSGDTLSAIAARHLGAARHWPMIRDANPGIDLDRLQVGQRILLPPRALVAREAGAATPAAGSTPTRPDTLRPGELMHEVRSGETLSSIAAARLGAARHWRLIADRNRDLLGGDPDRLKVGMTLRIPPKPRD